MLQVIKMLIFQRQACELLKLAAVKQFKDEKLENREWKILEASHDSQAAGNERKRANLNEDYSFNIPGSSRALTVGVLSEFKIPLQTSAGVES